MDITFDINNNKGFIKYLEINKEFNLIEEKLEFKLIKFFKYKIGDNEELIIKWFIWESREQFVEIYYNIHSEFIKKWNYNNFNQLITKWSYIKFPQYGTIQTNNVYKIFSSNQFIIPINIKVLNNQFGNWNNNDFEVGYHK